MNLLEDLTACLEPLGVPIETGVFSKPAPDAYLVITPLGDAFEAHADNMPQYETQEARLSLFSKGNYIRLKNAVIRALMGADLYITARRYIGHEDDTGYHHYAIDVAQLYEMEG